MRIGNRQIGIDHPPYIIAEIGVNHDGEVERALSLTDAAADAGADAVKLQFFETDRLMSKAAKLAAYQKNAGETDPIEMLRRLELTIDEMALVVDRAHERGIHAIVTVFSTELVEAAETLAWDAYKTASPDIVNRPLLEKLADTGKPMIVSTGASTLDEVVRAVGWLDDVRDRLAVLQCVSCYPAPEPAFGGIRAIAEATGLPIGYSDHTASHRTGNSAVVAGASLLEKHITDDRTRNGPDHKASLLTAQLGWYVETCRCGPVGRAMFSELIDTIAEFEVESQNQLAPKGMKKFWMQLSEVLRKPTPENPPSRSSPVFKAVMKMGKSKVNKELGSDAIHAAAGCRYEKRVLDCERDVREVSRQSVVTTGKIAPGETITREMLTIKRPGTGILAYRLDEVIGTVAKRAIEHDVPIVEEDLA